MIKVGPKAKTSHEMKFFTRNVLIKDLFAEEAVPRFQVIEVRTKNVDISFLTKLLSPQGSRRHQPIGAGCSLIVTKVNGKSGKHLKYELRQKITVAFIKVYTK